MNILIDLDNVLADFEKGFYERWSKKFPNKKAIDLEDRNTFYIYKQYPDEYRDLVSSIYSEEGFIKSLPPVEGGLKAVRSMEEMNHQVFICSSPLSNNIYSSSEKIEWVLNNLGEDFSKRTILTKDKTQIKGDILIDDRTNIKGRFKSSWTHLLFERPYNQKIKKQKKINWNNWKKVLSEFE